MKIFIVALRRSGTTAFWKTFRNDCRFTCYDEPFNPKLIELPNEHKKNIRKEYIDLLKKDYKKFWTEFSPIYPIQELDNNLNSKQINYFKYLADNIDNIIVDTTRCNFKLESLKENFPESFLIHLHRSPAGFITSHMLPRGESFRGKIKRFKRKRSFWDRFNDFNKWSYEDLIGDRKYGPFASKNGYNALTDKIENIPAFCKLAYFWKVNFNYIENMGTKLFGKKFKSIEFEEFCCNPKNVVSDFYRLIDIRKKDIDTSSINNPKTPYQYKNEKWEKAASLIGYDVNEFTRKRYLDC